MADNVNLDVGIETTTPMRVGDIQIPNSFYQRIPTFCSALDQMVGGCLMPGSTFTLCAPPGCGKTTLMLQLEDSIAAGVVPADYVVPENAVVEPRKTLYISGEESVVQLAFACQRLGLPHVEVCNNQEINGIVDHIVDYDMIMVDSFQCLRHENLSGRRLEIYAVNALTAAAKETGGVVGIIMHMTKDGKLKGNTMVPHTVDMTMYVAHADPEVYGPDVRCVYTEKNRFGRTGDLYLKMTSKGYDLANPITPVAAADGFTQKLFGSMLKQIDKVMITVDHLESVAHGARVPLKRLLAMMSILEAHNNVRVHGKGKNRVWTWN